MNRRCALDYDALDQCLTKLAERAAMNLMGTATIHMPRIGCGIAGGAWCDVEAVIARTLLARDLSVTVYDLNTPAAA